MHQPIVAEDIRVMRLPESNQISEARSHELKQMLVESSLHDRVRIYNQLH